MRNMPVAWFLLFALLVNAATSKAYAQEFQEGETVEQYDLVIEEALDQIEKSLDPAAVGGELSIEPLIPENPRVEIKRDISVEIEKLDEDIQDEETTAALEPIIVESKEKEAVEEEEVVVTPELEGKVIALLHAEASNLIDMLTKMKSPDGEINYNEDDRTLILKDIPGNLEAMSAFVKEIDVPLETGIFVFEYIRGAEMIDQLETALTKNIGQIQFNDEENSVLVTDTPQKVGEIKEIIKKADRYNVEVGIESRAMQIVLNDEHLGGVDWEAIVSEYQTLTTPGEEERQEKPLSVGTVSQEDCGILLEALETVGAVRTVYKEDVKTKNETVQTLRGFSEPDFALATQLFLTPRIQKDKPFEIIVQAKEDDQEGVKVQMDNGATIVVGGVFNNVMAPSTWKIPLLGDLPLLGFVFRNEGEKSRKAENMVFLTVTAGNKKIQNEESAEINSDDQS